MKILLINNNTVHLTQLNQQLSGHDVEIQDYRPGLDFHHQDKDLVILSGGGGEGLEIDDLAEKGKLWYEDQMKFIIGADKPILGICMGFEVMAKAHGQTVPHLGRHVSEASNVTATAEGWRLFGKPKLNQVQLHSWAVPQAPAGFTELARSENGLEMMYNPRLRQFGTQFHPELGGSLGLKDVLAPLVT